ncbi:MAG: L,D-transpeptidase family protein [Thermoleophilia bacterium]|nr:L,D-transpeptidase family protein [Thermoleophilia bacterium]
MRRLVFVAVPFFAFAPAAQAACGQTQSAVSGAAPLTVTFTAACASSAYTWSFGDGASATGQTVTHTFRAGYWRPALQTDAGPEGVQPVTSITLHLSAPHLARYGQWIALHASVVPRLPVTLRGRRFVHGLLRVRVLSPRPWVASSGGVKASAQTLVKPFLTVSVRGTPVVGGSVRVVATLHPASAGTVVGPRRVDARTAHTAHVTLRSRPAHGWVGVSRTLTVPVVSPSLSIGATGASVRMLERRLQELHYAVRADGYYGDDDVEAIYAFQKVEGLSRTGAVDAELWRRLAVAHVPRARYGGDHVEIDKTRQVIFIVRGGRVMLVIATSTGATGNTPIGVWHVYRKVAGFDWVLYYPNYFLRGFAVHGYPDVPPYPASHGCARIPMWVATTVYGLIPDGSAVYVYA